MQRILNKLIDPGSWASIYPLSCAGDYQSPINLESQTSNWINLPPFNFINYNTLFNEMTVSNNGYSGKILSKRFQF